jgi:hypothetical protein
LVGVGATVSATTEHCPNHEGNPGKVEVASDFGDTIVLPAGTEFCVKAAQQASGVLVSDGSPWTVTWLNQGGRVPGISYYVVYGAPAPTTTVPETTVPTTTVPDTTSTVPEVPSTTTVVPDTTVVPVVPSTAPVGTSTVPSPTAPEVTDTVPVVDAVKTTVPDMLLPNTGRDSVLGVGAVAALLLGVLLLAVARRGGM